MKGLVIKTLENQTLRWDERFMKNFYEFEDSLYLEKLMANKILRVELRKSSVYLITNNIISIQLRKDTKLDEVI